MDVYGSLREKEYERTGQHRLIVAERLDGTAPAYVITRTVLPFALVTYATASGFTYTGVAYLKSCVAHVVSIVAVFATPEHARAVLGLLRHGNGAPTGKVELRFRSHPA